MGGIMKHKVIITLLIIALFLISAIAVNKYIENQRYERYMSLQVANSISRLSTDLLLNREIYNNIIDLDTITLEQLELLEGNNNSLSMTTQDLRILAIDLKRIQHEDTSNATANNASDIGYFFRRLTWDKAENEGIDIESRVNMLPDELSSTAEFSLEKDEKKKIEMIRDLNERWINVVANNINGLSEGQTFNPDIYFDSYRDNAIKLDFWVDLIVQMEIETHEFLTENNHLDKMGTFLY